MIKVQFKKDFVHANGLTDKKGLVKLVTSRHAGFLEANGIAVRVKGKEEKEATNRETK